MAPLADARQAVCPAQPFVGAVGAGHEAGTATRSREGSFMLDVIMLAIALGFFALTVGYAYGCERL